MAIATGTAIGLAAGASLAGSLGSSLIGKSASDKAADAQVQASQINQQLLNDLYNDSKNMNAEQFWQQYGFTKEEFEKNKDLIGQMWDYQTGAISNQWNVTQPGYDAGTNALNQYMETLNDPQSYLKSPYYDFMVSEGTKALERGASAKGNLLGGAQAKALTRFGQNTASTDYANRLSQLYQGTGLYTNAVGARQNVLNSALQNSQTSQAARLGLSTNFTQMMNNILGNSITNRNAINTNYGAQATGQYTNAGNALAGGYINSANALTGGISSGMNNAMMAAYMMPRTTTYPDAPGSASYMGGGP